jgi:hypothetical protein
MWMEAHLHPTPLLREVMDGRVGNGTTHSLCSSLPHGVLVGGHAINFSKAQLGSNAGRHLVAGTLMSFFIMEN